MTAPLNLQGQIIEHNGRAHIEVLSRIQNSPAGKARWLCRCLLDNTIFPSLGASLLSKRTVSCGCYKQKVIGQRNRTHGMSQTPEYNAWNGMKQRCYDQTIRAARWYFGRVLVCQRYRQSFESFYQDVGPRPSPDHTLERKENNGHYSCGQCPECLNKGWAANVTWADWITQANNRRPRQYSPHTSACRIPSHHRCRHTDDSVAPTSSEGPWWYRDRLCQLHELANISGFSEATVLMRIRNGMLINEVVEKPHGNRIHPNPIIIHGETLRTAYGWQKALHLSDAVISYRLDHEWSLEKAVTTPLKGHL